MRPARQRVLVVDDKPTVRQMVAAFLGGEGVDVLEATNGLEALLRIKRERPDVVLLDLGIPRLGGLEALRRIRILDPGLKVVILTANPEHIREQATSIGAAAVLGALPSIRALAPGVPVVMVSGTSDEDLARQTLAQGVFDYVVKPVDLQYLAQTVEMALTMAQLDQG